LLPKRLVFNCCFQDTGISQGSAQRHTCGILSECIITNVLLIQTVK